MVAKWAFDPTGKTTPRAAADGFLTAHKGVPRVVINPVVNVEVQMVEKADGKAIEYDRIGGLENLGWTRSM